MTSELEAPSVVSSGYFVVDLISRRDGFLASPGGTASNIASALHSLGWNGSIAGAIGDDPAGRYFVDVLTKDGLGTSNVRLHADWTTPVIVQVDNGTDHRWLFKCPHCGRRFARHRPPSQDETATVLNEQVPSVFVFDRLSRFTIHLAKVWKEAGSLIFFEPSALGRPQLFDEAAELADVVKYSSARSSEFEARLESVAAIQVKTLGVDGAIWKESGGAEWNAVSIEPALMFVDSVGAGDWTSAGFLDSLFRANGSWSELISSASAVAEAVQSGIRLGARACEWEGFRPSSWNLPSESVVTSPRFYCPYLSHHGMEETES